jgi:hypothetical protein
MHLNRLTGGIAALTLLATPAIASAHGTGSKGHRHHARHQTKAKKAQTREVTGPATATVTSFTGGELTITLANGKSYSGLVTDKTILRCNTAAPQSTTARAARNGSDDSAGDNGGPTQDQGDDDAQDNTSQGTSNQVNDSQGTSNQRDDEQGDDDGQGDDDAQGAGNDNGNGACDTSALIAGTKVSNAELSLKGTDAAWKSIELVK